MPCCFSLPFVKRKLICISLWIVFAFLCAYFAWSWDESLKNNPDFWWSSLMWVIVFNRILISWVVLIIWVFTVHPLWFRILPIFRWFIVWAFVSLDLAIWSMISWWENALKYFWLTILMWAIYWMIIDFVATKLAWEWVWLLDFGKCTKQVSTKSSASSAKTISSKSTTKKKK